MSISELLLMGTLQFRIILERFSACFTSPEMWGKAGLEFITNGSHQKISVEAVPMAILGADGVGEGNLGMVTTFWHHDEAKVEVFKELSALHQCNMPEPSAMVVQKFTNSASLPQGSFGILYLDHSLWGHFICPTGPATPMQATPLLLH